MGGIGRQMKNLPGLVDSHPAGDLEPNLARQDQRLGFEGMGMLGQFAGAPFDRHHLGLALVGQLLRKLLGTHGGSF